MVLVAGFPGFSPSVFGLSLCNSNFGSNELKAVDYTKLRFRHLFK